MSLPWHPASKDIAALKERKDALDVDIALPPLQGGFSYSLLFPRAGAALLPWAIF